MPAQDSDSQSAYDNYLLTNFTISGTPHQRMESPENV